MMLLQILLTSAFAMSPQVVTKNNLAVKNFEKKYYFNAYQKFVDALVKEPFEPILHLNLARTFQQNEENDKALQEYELIRRLPNADSDLLFKAAFNAGTIMAAQENIPAALNFYQQALKQNPNSFEAKTNIELLWKSGKGKGQGKNQQKDQNKDQSKDQNKSDNKDNKDKQDARKQDQTGEETQKQPQKFESKDLSQEDVRKILEEIKNQEQQIRAEINKKEVKETPREKNW